MNLRLLDEDVQQLMQDLEGADLSGMALKLPVMPGVSASEFLSFLSAKRKAEVKWPRAWLSNHIYYPPVISIEQSSSAITSKLKSELITYSSVLDLTGGAGIDIWQLSRKAEKACYIERDAELCNIAAHNFKLTGAENIEVINTSAEDFLENNGNFDLIYLDPARREGGGRVFRLEDCSPNLKELMPVLREKANVIMVKVSPLLDISSLFEALGGETAVYVISVKNEVKEVLGVTGRGVTGDRITALDYDGVWKEFSFERFEEVEAKAQYGDPSVFLYEPNAAIMKAGGFRTVSVKYGLKKLSANAHLYTGTDYIRDFPGRIFEVLSEVKNNRMAVLDMFPEGRAAIFTRNYPMKPEELRKKLKLGESDSDFLAGTTLANGRKVLLALRRISSYEA